MFYSLALTQTLFQGMTSERPWSVGQLDRLCIVCLLRECLILQCFLCVLWLWCGGGGLTMQVWLCYNVHGECVICLLKESFLMSSLEIYIYIYSEIRLWRVEYGEQDGGKKIHSFTHKWVYKFLHKVVKLSCSPYPFLRMCLRSRVVLVPLTGKSAGFWPTFVYKLLGFSSRDPCKVTVCCASRRVVWQFCCAFSFAQFCSCFHLRTCCRFWKDCHLVNPISKSQCMQCIRQKNSEWITHALVTSRCVTPPRSVFCLNIHTK